MTYHQNWKKDVWEVPTPKEATECSHCDLNSKIEFVLTPKIVSVSRQLCARIKREWQILLIGKEIEGGFLFYDYYVPKQETSLASVKNLDEISLEFVKEKKIIGTMHSHNEMGCSFSGTDDQCTNHSFIKNHIVTNNNHDWLAVSRIELPCGLISFAKAKVIMQVPEIHKVKGIENIEEHKWLPVIGGSTYFHDSRSGQGFYNDHLPKHYQPKDVDWKKNNKRSHAFEFDQNEHGGICYGE